MKNKKQKMAKGDFWGIVIFYAVIIIGVIVLNARFEYLNENSKKADYKTAQIVNK